jgi:hypothetical protein
VTAAQIERLEKILARVAREQGLDQERLRRWASFLALCGVLEHALEQGVISAYHLKGGVAMELRFAPCRPHYLLHYHCAALTVLPALGKPTGTRLESVRSPRQKSSRYRLNLKKMKKIIYPYGEYRHYSPHKMRMMSWPLAENN